MRPSPRAQVFLGGKLRRARSTLSERVFVLATIAPAIVLLSVYVFLPTLYSFYLSAFKTKLFTPLRFVGLDQYVSILTDSTFWISLRNTAYFAGVSVVGTLVCGLGVALLLEKSVRGKGFFRTVYFMPYIMPYAAYALLWYWLFDPRYGLVNYMLSFLGIKAIPWLQSSAWVIPAFILMGIWKRMGFAMVLFLAGLSTIPDDLYDAATVEGSSWWSKLLHVTLPLLSPITLFVTVISLIYSMQLFVEPFIMTKGGPANASMSVVYMLYQEGFYSLNVGRGSAIAVILFALIMALTLLLVRRFDIEEVYG